MQKRKWKTYAFWIVLTELVGALAGFLSREGTELYQASVLKPALTPPGWVFPVVWGILYLLMGIAAARIALLQESVARRAALRVYGLQLAVNFLWPLLFFNLQAFGAAFLWLVLLFALIVWMILSFRELDKAAAWLLLPYLLWTAFAGYLNLGVWLLNR